MQSCKDEFILYTIKSHSDVRIDYDTQCLLFFDLDDTLVYDDNTLIEPINIFKHLMCKTMGFTSRKTGRKYGGDFLTHQHRTVLDLQKLGIHFSSILPGRRFVTSYPLIEEEKYNFEIPDGAMLYEGIIFTNNVDKGSICEEFLNTLYSLPRLIGFVDNDLKNLVSVGCSIRSYNRIHGVNIKYHAYHISK